MNPFRPLLKLLDFVLGHDLHERAPGQKRPEVKRPPRSSAPQGDGFDSRSGGPRVDLRGGVKVAPKLPDEPAGPPAVIEPSSFNASLDDLSQLVDEPMEPRPEFIPEGGMSTESLMREFSSLDAETQAAAVELAAAKELAQAIELEDPEKFVDSFERTSLPLPAPQGEGVQTPAWLMPATAPAPKPAAALPPPEFSTESLMSEFESLTPEAQLAAVEEAAAEELARQEAEAAKKEALAPLPAPQGAGVQTPAWLMPPTAPAPKREVPPPPPELSTESLMSEFESLTPEAQQAAIEEAAAKELARQEAEAAEEAALAPLPSPLPATQGEGVQTPAWLMPATAPAPKPVVPLPPPELSTESLMSEFESLDPETQQAAIDEAAAKELARQQAEEAKKQALAPHPDPLPAPPQGEGED